MTKKQELQDKIFDKLEKMPIEAQVPNMLQMMKTQQMQLNGLTEAIGHLTTAVNTISRK